MARTFKSRSEVNDRQDCPVCGNSIEVPGFDCAICQFVYEFPDDTLRIIDRASLFAAIGKALDAATAFQGVPSHV